MGVESISTELGWDIDVKVILDLSMDSNGDISERNTRLVMMITRVKESINWLK